MDKSNTFATMHQPSSIWEMIHDEAQTVERQVAIAPYTFVSLVVMWTMTFILTCGSARGWKLTDVPEAGTVIKPVVGWVALVVAALYWVLVP